MGEHKTGAPGTGPYLTIPGRNAWGVRRDIPVTLEAGGAAARAAPHTKRKYSSPGDGVSLRENRAEWHGKAPNKAELGQAPCDEMREKYGLTYQHFRQRVRGLPRKNGSYR